MSEREIRLDWSGAGLAFEGGAPDGPQIVLDGDRAVGPSPMDLVLMGVAGCMAIDVRAILEKGRVPFDGLHARASGRQRGTAPRRYDRIRMTFRVTGLPAGGLAKVERAVRLSREKHCSVLHSLRPDLELETAVEGA